MWRQRDHALVCHCGKRKASAGKMDDARLNIPENKPRRDV